MRVLLVEDDALVRLYAAEALADEGFEVVEADTADEALRLCAESAPDVLFTDIRLPGKLTGWDIAERCRQHHPDMPVIYATGYSEGPHRPVPNSVFLQKPYKAEHVADIMRRLSSRSHS